VEGRGPPSNTAKSETGENRKRDDLIDSASYNQVSESAETDDSEDLEIGIEAGGYLSRSTTAFRRINDGKRRRAKRRR
jgi:hypothetical protein